MSGFATGGVVSFAPLGSSLEDASAWTPLGHTVSGYALSGWADVDHRTWDLTETLNGRTISFSFKARRKDLKRMIRLLSVRRSPAAIRRSAMRSEYHRRSRRR